MRRPPLRGCPVAAPTPDGARGALDRAPGAPASAPLGPGLLAGPAPAPGRGTRRGPGRGPARDPAGSRRGRRGVVLPGHPRGVDDAAEQGERPDGYPIDYDRAALQRPQAVVCTGCHLEPPRPTSPAATGVCADCRADGLGRDPIVVRCEAILPRRCAADRGPAASCGGCGTPPTPPTGPPSPPGSPPTTPASPRPRATADPRLPSPRPGHPTVTGPLRGAVGRWRRSASPARTRRARAS